jgi:DNA-binding transcriptional regulator YbjK
VKKPAFADFRELAKRRLQRLLEPNQEELEKEIEEARRKGYTLICAPGLTLVFDQLLVMTAQPHADPCP